MMRRQPQAWAFAREGLKAPSRVGIPCRAAHSDKSWLLGEEPNMVLGRGENQREGLAQPQPSDLRRSVLWTRGCR